MKKQPTTQRVALFTGLACLLLALTLSACDSATPETTPQVPAIEEAQSLFPTYASKEQERLPVCHLNDEGAFMRIEVAEPAYDTHLAHGDGAIGGAVPGMPSYVFDEACQPVAASCPCFTATDLDAFTLDFGVTVFGEEVHGDQRSTYLIEGILESSSIVEAAFVGEGSGFACRLIDRNLADESLSIFVEDPDITAAEAEACRGLIYDEAADRDIPCEGDTCGLPYTP